MKLCDVVAAMVEKGRPTAKDVEDTVLFLMRGAVTDVRVLRRVMKKLNNDLAYENAPIS